MPWTEDGIRRRHRIKFGVEPTPPAPLTTSEINNFFGQVGDQIYEDCIFELSKEQLEAQNALIEAYIKQGATQVLARQLAVKQIQPPKLSAECEQMRGSSKTAMPKAVATPSAPEKPATPAVVPKSAPATPASRGSGR